MNAQHKEKSHGGEPKILRHDPRRGRVGRIRTRAGYANDFAEDLDAASSAARIARLADAALADDIAAGILDISDERMGYFASPAAIVRAFREVRRAGPVSVEMIDGSIDASPYLPMLDLTHVAAFHRGFVGPYRDVTTRVALELLRQWCRERWDMSRPLSVQEARAAARRHLPWLLSLGLDEVASVIREANNEALDRLAPEMRLAKVAAEVGRGDVS